MSCRPSFTLLQEQVHCGDGRFFHNTTRSAYNGLSPLTELCWYHVGMLWHRRAPGCTWAVKNPAWNSDCPHSEFWLSTHDPCCQHVLQLLKFSLPLHLLVGSEPLERSLDMI